MTSCAATTTIREALVETTDTLEHWRDQLALLHEKAAEHGLVLYGADLDIAAASALIARSRAALAAVGPGEETA